MRKMLLILLTFCALQLQAQKVTTVYGCKASIIYKSKDDFKIAYLQYYRALLYPGDESKTMKANPSRFKQTETDSRQKIISKNLIFGKNGTLTTKLKSLDQYLSVYRNTALKIDIVDGVVYRIELLKALPLSLREKWV